MNSDHIAIRVENLSKRYRIGLKDERRETFASAAVEFMKSPLKNYRKYRSLYKFDESPSDAGQASDVIWALRDVSFEVGRGEVVGIIGKNGAGKSTLLKILTRITNPTSGSASIHGRVSSLLEVGTGFHPELTGRENVYLNGTVLGMKKKEIDRSFDEIVAFSEVEKFLDTPVKRYSSGMRVRLAFSVAAHLQSEVLLIDEVLTVGDTAFQKKCLGKMEGISKEGRTVLFVSHNMGIISELCGRCVLLSTGEVCDIGETKEIVSKYVATNSLAGGIDLSEWQVDRRGEGPMRIIYLNITDGLGPVRTHFEHGEPITFHIGIAGRPGNACIIGVSVKNAYGQLILHFSNADDSADLILQSRESEIRMGLEKNILNDGMYYVTVWLGDKFDILNDVVRNCLSFTVQSPSNGRIKSKSPIRMRAVWDVKAAVPRPGESLNEVG
jgi:lipopolysaccharide transport system ATP-binding protein